MPWHYQLNRSGSGAPPPVPEVQSWPPCSDDFSIPEDAAGATECLFIGSTFSPAKK
jgi:hypothetical protein